MRPAREPSGKVDSISQQSYYKLHLRRKHANREGDMADKKKYWSGQTCPETATYGQYHDTNDAYAGVEYDRYVKAGETFPPSRNNHHFSKK
jgi:hypothetical protein